MENPPGTGGRRPATERSVDSNKEAARALAKDLLRLTVEHISGGADSADNRLGDYLDRHEVDMSPELNSLIHETNKQIGRFVWTSHTLLQRALGLTKQEVLDLEEEAFGEVHRGER